MKFSIIFVLLSIIFTASEGNLSEVLFEWKKLNENAPKLPENTVIGGHNPEGKILFLIRNEIDGKILFGDAEKEDTTDAFVIDTNNDSEIATTDYEVLTAEKYVWCKYESHKWTQDIPVCRAPHNGGLLTGTSLADGSCRLVFSIKTIKTADVDILVIGKTSCDDE